MPNQAPSAPSRLINIIYGIANLANYIVGAGILGLPFVFSKTGWLVGCFLILIAAFATSLSFDFLLQASAASGCYSYDALALRTGGTRLQKVRPINIYC
jgi:amino acid permease